MKKTLLAAALLAGFATAGVAQAETSVTLYGILDTGYGYSQYKYSHDNYSAKTTSSGLRSGFINGNRFGLKGSEDLGDGLRAIFQLENGFDLGNGQFSGQSNAKKGDDSSVGFNRQAYVGLSSDNWGTFTMGRQYNIGDSYFGATTFGSSIGDTDKAFGSKSQRVNNMFKYQTPDFAGFQAAVGYAANGAVVRQDSPYADGKDRGNYTTAGLKYSNGPIYAAVIYDRLGASGTGNDFNVTNWAITGSYDFEVVKLALAYGQDRNGKINGMLGSDTATGALPASTLTSYDVEDFKSNNYYVGLSAPLGGGTAVATWTRSSANLDDVYGNDDLFKTQNLYSVKYQYPLSKRTSVYAYGAYGTGVAYIDGLKAKEAGIGLNHKF